MKKTLMGLAVLAMSLAPSMAFAQSATSTATESQKKEICQNNQKCADKKECKKGDFKGKGKCRPDKCREASIFETLNLTTEQQGQIKALNDARKVSCQEAMQKERENIAKGDTVKRDRKVRQEISRKYLSDLQTILTADQYVQFLEQNYVNSQSAPGHFKANKAKNVKNACEKACHSSARNAEKNVKPAKRG